MKYSNTIEYNITTKLDSSGLTKMQNQIREVELSLQKMGNSQDGFFAGQIEQARKELQGLNKALTEAFNPSLGIIDISKFRAELVKGKVDSEGLASAFRLAGTDGQVAFNNLISQLGTFDAGMQRTSSAVDKMWTTFQNTFRWGLVSSFFSQFMNAIHSSVDYVKELDDSLTQIMLVTDYNRDSMNQFAKSANEAAKAVSMTTTGMTNASLIFAQQGYDLGQSQELATLSAKLANASQQDTATTSDQITAYMNAYGLQNSMEELTQQMDNWALIANVSAADVGELAQASQRAASMANTVGVSGEALAAQIATIESVTREAPEQIGNGLKTLYARFSDISGGGKDEDGVDLGKVTAQLDAIGVKVLDQFGNIRTMDNIMEDLMDVWADLDDTAKIAAAQSLAGKYQVNRFVALMDNRDMYEEYIGATGNSATGTLDQMNQEYAESLAGRATKLQTTLEGIFSSIFNTEDIYPFIDAMQSFLDLVQDFIDAVGGAGPILTGVIALIGQLFSKNIANAFIDQKINNDLAKIQAENYKNAPAAIAQLGLSNPDVSNQNTQALLNFAQRGSELASSMSDQGIQSYNNLLRENTQLANQAAEAESQFQNVIEKVNAVLGVQLNSEDFLQKDETGLNTSPLLDILRNLENGNLNNNQESWNEAINSVENYQTALANLHKEMMSYQSNQDLSIFDSEKIDRVKIALEQMALTGAMSEDQVNNIKIVLDSLNDTMQVADKDTEEWASEIKDASSEVEKLQSRANSLDETLIKLSNNGGIKDKSKLQGLSDEIEKTQVRKEATQGAAEGGQRQMSAFLKDVEQVDITKNIISAASALGQLASAIMAVQNLGSIWRNEDLSTGEKILQTILSLSTVIPQTVSGMNALSKAFTGSNINLLGGLNQAKDNLQKIQNEMLSSGDKIVQAHQKVIDAQKRVDEATSKSYEATSKVVAAHEKYKAALEDTSRSEASRNGQLGVLRKAEKEAALAAEEQTAADLALSEAQMAETATAEADTVAQEELAIAKKGVAIATGQLLATLLIPLAIGGIITVIGNLIEKEKEAQEAREAAMQAIADETTNTVQQINQVRDSFNDLWDQYKITGEASDQFKNALEQQCEILGITDGELLIAQGKYDELKTKIDAATESVYANNAALLAANLENKDQNPATQLTKAQQEKIGITTHTETEVREGTGTDTGTSSVWAKEVYDQSAYQQVKAAQDYIEQSQEKVNELTKERIQAAKDGDAIEIERIDQQLGILAQDIATYQDFVNANRDIISASEQIRDNQLDMELADPKSIFKKGSYDEIKDFIQEIGGETVDSSNIDELIAKYAELAGNADVAAEAAKNLKEAVEDSDLDSTLDLPENNYRSNEQHDAVKKDLKISDEEYKGYQNALIDNNQYLEGLSKEAEYLEKNNEVLQEHRRELQKETKALQEEKDALEEKAEKLKDNESQYAKVQKQIRDYSKQIEKNQKELKKEVKNSEDVQDQLEDLENKIIETAVGAKELGEVWEDNSAVLRDGESDWAQQADAINNLAPGLAHLLNMDLSDIQALPQSFWESTQNLNDMEAAINGDVEALQRLRGEATKELLVKAGIDPTSDLYGEMLELIDMANAVLPDLEAGATIDDSQFIAKLNEMIATTIAAGGDIEAVLAAYERLGLQFTQTGTTTMQVPHVTMQTTGSSIGQGIGGLKQAEYASAAGIEMTPSVTWETVEVPTYDYKKTSGGAGFTGGYTPKDTGGSGKGSCFIAGTLVTTLTGFKPIEEIQKGDIVLSYNERIKVNEYSEVIQTMIHDTTEPIYTLYIKDEQLRVTGVHRFLVTNKITCGIPQWVHAADLKVGNWVMFADNSWHVIHKIDVNIEHRTVYNFEVSYNHNYYVGHNQILAHNKGSCFVAGTQISTINGFRVIENIQPNDIVLSYNEQTGYNEYSSVVQTMIHDTKEPIYTLYIQNEQLRVTGIHRFFITKNILTGIPQWIAAENLKVGDWVLFANGTWHVIWKIEVNIEQQTVYNFEVSGNHNYYVGRNQILAHNKGGGKKGGGGGKKKEIKSKEEREHEKDYYEEVNSQLDKTEKILSKIEKEEDRLIGDKARANQNKQLKLLQKEIDLNEKKLKIQKRELKDVDALIKKEDKRAEKAALNAGVRANIPGVALDEDGVVSNYEQISKAIDKTYNDLVKKYNEAAKKGNEELTKKLEKDMSKFDDYSKNLLEQIKRHNKLQGEIVETESDLESLADAMEDIRIDAYKASQEAIDNLKEIKESAAELDKLFRNFDDSSFMNKFSIDDTPYGDLIEDLSKLDNIYSVTKKDANAFYQDLINQKEEALKNTKDEDEQQAIQKSIDFFTEQQSKLKDGANLENGLLGLAQQDLARLQGWIDNPKAADNIYGDNEAALFEAYQDAYNRTLGLFKDYRELVQSTRDDILDIYSDAEEAIERQIDQFDRLSEKMERISDTYTLYYGEDSYDQLDKFYAQQGSIMQAQLNQLTAAYDFWRKNYEKALENGNEELIKKAKDLMDDAEDAMLDGAKELAELWVEKFENAVEANTQSIYNKLFNGQDFNDLSSNWELQKDYMERYKDNVEKSYEIEKLRSKYTDLLNDSQNASLLTQNKIRQQMQEQLQQLQEQARVSEYDVKLANARLEILQKQIALEDAQRNKRQMQLRRDSQGNYRYVYKADQKDVKEAQDDLLDSEFDAYELTKNETISNNDRALNLVQDFLSKRADIFNKYKDDDVARKKALEELSNNYSELLAGMEEDFRDTTNGMFDVLTFMVQNGTEATAVSAANMLDNLFEKEGKFKEDTKVLWAALVNTMTGALEEFQDAIAEANDELIDQTEDLKDKMTGNDGVLTKIGSSSEKMANSLDTATQATMDLAQATDQLFTAFKADDKRMEDALAKLKKYEDQLRSTQDTTSSLSKQLASANAAITAKTAEAQSYQDSIDLMNGTKKFEVGQVVTLKKGTWVSYHRDGDQYDSKGDNGFRLSKDTQVKISHVNEHHTKGYGDTSKLAKYNIGFYEVGKEATKETGTGLANKSDTKKTERWHLNESMLRQAITYDTGGYTGQWGGEETNLSKNGKLAVLHQKELVLNATDTENILNAVNVMREITNALKNSNTYVSTFRNAVSAGNDTIEQRVEISATFPNVSSITDIEQALLNLSDQAYQYAHRNIKG